MKAHVNLHIEKLVLEDVSPADRHKVATAMQTELARLFAAQVPELLRQAATIGKVDVGQIETANLSPQKTGVQLAQQIYKGMEQ